MSKVSTAFENEPMTNEMMEGGAEDAEAKVGEDGYTSVTEELDDLLLQASHMIELQLKLQDSPTERREEARFARPKTDAEVL